MNKLIAFLFSCIFTLTVCGQEKTDLSHSFRNKNSIQVELFGHGLFYSLNYERIILNGERFKTSGQAGLAYYPPKADVRDVWVPAVINELISFERHHLEFGLGYVFINEENRSLQSTFFGNQKCTKNGNSCTHFS